MNTKEQLEKDATREAYDAACTARDAIWGVAEFTYGKAIHAAWEAYKSADTAKDAALEAYSALRQARDAALLVSNAALHEGQKK